jgi:hypothetical protein
LFHKPDKSEVEVAFFRVGSTVAIKTVLSENGPNMPFESGLLRVCSAVHAKQYRCVRSQKDKFAEEHSKRRDLMQAGGWVETAKKQLRRHLA